MARYTFTIDGMHCASCGLLIDDAVEQLEGVHTASTSLRTGRTTVELDESSCTPADVVTAIAEVGYTARAETS